ncbi:hypothetical protein FQN54_003234 [Arachnomyces sp. PD_36]|nr:hypothetical protein FQN54_003234 [Arachnomyces sp. PD_36]
MRNSWLFGLSVLLGFIAPQLVSSSEDALKGWHPEIFRRLFSHSSIVVDNHVYVIGGEMQLQDGDTWHPTSLLSTLTIPLDKSWTNSTLEIVSTDNPSDFPQLKAPSLWWDSAYSNSIYYMAGATSMAETTEIDPLSVWVYLLEDNLWAELYGPDDDIWNNMTRPTRCGSVYTPKAGFCLGGYSGPWSTDVDAFPINIPIEGMISFDFESKTWDNISSVGSSQRGWLVEHEMEYIPSYGEEGILISMGGNDLESQISFYDAENLRSMSNITIYDIKTQKWFSQATSGDVPTGRNQFCTVVAQGGDNDSWEIFMYGGTNGHRDASANDSDQVYVLSLPAFRWFQSDAVTQPRFMHTCELVGKRQMLSIGGVHAQIGDTVDPFIHGLGIFDLTDWEWKPIYDAEAADYVPHDTINQWYQDHSRYPRWDSSEVQALIENPSNGGPTLTGESGADVTPTDSTPSGAGASPELPDQTDSSTPIGPIIGGIIGGVVVIGIILTIIVIMRRKKKNQNNGEDAKELDVPFQYRTKDPLVHTRTPAHGPGELENNQPDPFVKENRGGKFTELEGSRHQEQKYHRGQPVRPPQRGLTELES